MNDTTDESLDAGFSQLESVYTEPEDLEKIKANRRAYNEATDLSLLLEGSAGDKLLEWMNNEITTILLLLLNTRESRYLSDLKSMFDLRKKLTNAKTVKSSIEDWLSKLN